MHPGTFSKITSLLVLSNSVAKIQETLQTAYDSINQEGRNGSDMTVLRRYSPMSGKLISLLTS